MDTTPLDCTLSPNEASIIDVPSRRVRWRLCVCAAAYFVGGALATVPRFDRPYGPQPLMSMTFAHIAAMSNTTETPRYSPADVLLFFMFFASLLALTLVLPVLIYQGLAIFGPPVLSARKRSRTVATVLLSLMFMVGVVAGISWIVPPFVRFSVIYDSWDIIPGLYVHWRIADYVASVAGLVYLVGLAFQLPLWPAVLVRLQIANPGQLARCRRYILLVAVILATVLLAPLINPTRLPVPAALVAVPLYLLYELGLQLTRLIPAPPLRAGEGVGG